MSIDWSCAELHDGTDTLHTVARTPSSSPSIDKASAAEELQSIQTLTDAALAHLGFEDLLDQLLERTRDVLGADTAAILLLDSEAGELVATAAKGIEAEVLQGTRIPIGKGFAGRIAASAQPLILDIVDHTTVLNPILYENGIRSLSGAPLISAGRVLGVVHVGTLAPREFTETDSDLLQLVGDRAASAISSHLSSRERDAARDLQASLLPTRLPSVPGIELAARYLPGAHGSLGGDWYDVLPLSHDRVGLVIGDVVGKGLAAAVVMGRLRSALRAYAVDSDDPAEILARLDHMVVRLEANEMATVLYGVLEPATGRLLFSSAGHPPPVLATPGCDACVVEIASDPPIGIGWLLQRRNHVVEIPEGGSLQLYTDGVIERRGRPIDEGLAYLCAAAQPGPGERDVRADRRSRARRGDAGRRLRAALRVPPLPSRWRPRALHRRHSQRARRDPGGAPALAPRHQGLALPTPTTCSSPSVRPARTRSSTPTGPLTATSG